MTVIKWISHDVGMNDDVNTNTSLCDLNDMSRMWICLFTCNSLKNCAGFVGLKIDGPLMIVKELIKLYDSKFGPLRSDQKVMFGSFASAKRVGSQNMITRIRLFLDHVGIETLPKLKNKYLESEKEPMFDLL